MSGKITIDNSAIHGKAMIAKEKIQKGKIVFIKAGHIIPTGEEFNTGTVNSYLPIDDDYVVGATNAEEEDRIKLWINHSCRPNAGMRGEITFIAMRDIPKDEEVTIDYAMVDDEEYEFDCNCGEKNCRGKVTGFDWKLPELQKKYGMYFARYLRDKFDPVV